LFLVSNLHLLVVSIAIVGFLLFFSLAVFIPMAWDFRARARRDISALLDFRMRFISRNHIDIISDVLVICSLLFPLPSIHYLPEPLVPNLVSLSRSFGGRNGSRYLVFRHHKCSLHLPRELKEILEYYERTTSP
jgi:hypothetical protein